MPQREAVRDVGGVEVVPADLSDVDGLPQLADQVRATVGTLDAFYFGASIGGFASAVDLTPEAIRAFFPLSLAALVTLVGAFLPPMLERGDGAILTTQGKSATMGIPHLSGPGPALAAQRNYLQSQSREPAEVLFPPVG